MSAAHSNGRQQELEFKVVFAGSFVSTGETRNLLFPEGESDAVVQNGVRGLKWKTVYKRKAPWLKHSVEV